MYVQLMCLHVCRLHSYFFVCVCVCFCLSVCMFMYRAMNLGCDKGCKTTFESLSAKMNEYSKVRTCFYQCCSYLDGYRMPPKLDYCFITSTSLVSVAVSTWI